MGKFMEMARKVLAKVVAPLKTRIIIRFDEGGSPKVFFRKREDSEIERPIIHIPFSNKRYRDIKYQAGAPKDTRKPEFTVVVDSYTPPKGIFHKRFAAANGSQSGRHYWSNEEWEQAKGLYLDGKTDQEIADALNLKKSVVTSKLVRMRQKGQIPKR